MAYSLMGSWVLGDHQFISAHLHGFWPKHSGPMLVTSTLGHLRYRQLPCLGPQVQLSSSLPLSLAQASSSPVPETHTHQNPPAHGARLLGVALGNSDRHLQSPEADHSAERASMPPSFSTTPWTTVTVSSRCSHWGRCLQDESRWPLPSEHRKIDRKHTVDTQNTHRTQGPTCEDV